MKKHLLWIVPTSVVVGMMLGIVVDRSLVAQDRLTLIADGEKYKAQRDKYQNNYLSALKDNNAAGAMFNKEIAELRQELAKKEASINEQYGNVQKYKSLYIVWRTISDPKWKGDE